MFAGAIPRLRPSSFDVLLGSIQRAVALDLDPLLDLLVAHEIRAVEAIPAHDLVQVLLPALVDRLRGWSEAHDVEDRQLGWDVEQWPDGLLGMLLSDRRNPPDVVTKCG